MKKHLQQLSSTGPGLATPLPSPKVQKGSDEGLVRAIGLNSAVLMVLGAVVGSGNFPNHGCNGSLSAVCHVVADGVGGWWVACPHREG